MKKFGLLGERLAHSFSPYIHSKIGDYDYRLFEVERDKLDEFMRNKCFDGINVTIPYKQSAMAYCDKISDRAKKIGCVNTIRVMNNNEIFGDNTDYFGFKYLLDKNKIVVKDKKCAVLGSGASSKTVSAVLYDMGARNIVFVSRKGICKYEDVEVYNDAEILINTTPLGMFPNNGEIRVDLTVFTRLEACVDIVYNPHRTKLVLQCEKMGIKAVGGIEMLIAQGVRAGEIFENKTIDDGVIEKIAGELIRNTQNIILIGMPSCGKTTIGKALARTLKRDFLDSDDMIYQRCGKSPANIINSMGESCFRAAETELLKDIGRYSGKIIATGGGAVTVKENYDYLHQNGAIIWLKRDLDKLVTKGRPLSQGDNALNRLYEERKAMYVEFSDLVIDNNGEIANTVKEVLKAAEYEDFNY